MSEKCQICKEYIYEWRKPHYCKPKFYVWEADGGATFTDAYDLSSGIYSDDAQSAAEAYFCSDFERKEAVYMSNRELNRFELLSNPAVHLKEKGHPWLGRP